MCRGDNRLDLGNRLGTGLAGDTISLPSIVPLVVAMVTVACMPKTVAGVGIIGFGAGMSLAASDISDSDGSSVAGVAGVLRHTGMLRSRYCVYFVLMNGLIGGVARGAADIGRIARIGGMMRSFGRIQQVVLGMAIRRIWCLPQHAGKVGGRNHILHLTQPRVQVG